MTLIFTRGNLRANREPNHSKFVLTIAKSITIDCGTNAGGILNAGTNGVMVNAGVNDKVVLRNLVIQGTIGTTQGLNGIR